MAGEFARKRATYDDVLSAPPGRVAEVIEGVLYSQPRPHTRHARAATTLGSKLDSMFGGGDDDGIGGWVILFEPELHLGADILVPDLAGWERARMPELPDTAYLDLAPDFSCEILSPGTARLDRGEKLPIYAREGVKHVWLVDPISETLEVLRLDGATYRIVAVHHGKVEVRAEPFEASSISLARLWAR